LITIAESNLSKLALKNIIKSSCYNILLKWTKLVFSSTFTYNIKVKNANKEMFSLFAEETTGLPVEWGVVGPVVAIEGETSVTAGWLTTGAPVTAGWLTTVVFVSPWSWPSWQRAIEIKTNRVESIKFFCQKSGVPQKYLILVPPFSKPLFTVETFPSVDPVQKYYYPES